jgi:hypothetical protein
VLSNNLGENDGERSHQSKTPAAHLPRPSLWSLWHGSNCAAQPGRRPGQSDLELRRLCTRPIGYLVRNQALGLIISDADDVCQRDLQGRHTRDKNDTITQDTHTTLQDPIRERSMRAQPQGCDMGVHLRSQVASLRIDRGAWVDGGGRGPRDSASASARAGARSDGARPVRAFEEAARGM